MTFYDWAMSEYFDSSCPLRINISNNYIDLRDDIIGGNISYDDSILIRHAGGAPIIPVIYTDTIIQPISYMPNFGGFE